MVVIGADLVSPFTYFLPHLVHRSKFGVISKYSIIKLTKTGNFNTFFTQMNPGMITRITLSKHLVSYAFHGRYVEDSLCLSAFIALKMSVVQCLCNV